MSSMDPVSWREYAIRRKGANDVLMASSEESAVLAVAGNDDFEVVTHLVTITPWRPA